MRDLFNSFVSDESGQGLTEYVLIIALVAVGLILVLVAFRDQIGAIFDGVNEELEGANIDQYTPGGGD
jgi:pilus assembly protein Flp/PilA